MNPFLSLSQYLYVGEPMNLIHIFDDFSEQKNSPSQDEQFSKISDNANLQKIS